MPLHPLELPMFCSYVLIKNQAPSAYLALSIFSVQSCSEPLTLSLLYVCCFCLLTSTVCLQWHFHSRNKVVGYLLLGQNILRVLVTNFPKSMQRVFFYIIISCILTRFASVFLWSPKLYNLKCMPS